MFELFHFTWKKNPVYWHNSRRNRMCRAAPLAQHSSLAAGTELCQRCLVSRCLATRAFWDSAGAALWNVILQQCNKLVADSGNNPFFPKKAWGGTAILKSRTPPAVRQGEGLLTAGKFSGFCCNLTHIWYANRSVCAWSNSFIFMQGARDEVKVTQN